MIIVVLAMIYGVCMGTFAVFRPKGAEPMQVLASMVKVPLLFYLTLLVTFPSLYVFNALVGSRLRLGTVVRLLVASLGVMVAVLASLGPIVAFFLGEHGQLSVHASVQRGRLHGGGHARHGVPASDSASSERGRFAAAACRRVVEPGDRWSFRTNPAGALDPLENRVLSKHVKTVFRLWVVVFALVGAQMGWVLRPFVGNPSIRHFTWFRPRESNFFQAVFQTFQSLFS